MLYKTDLSRAFCHVKIDLKDYNLLSLQIDNEIYYDSSLPFGFKHGRVPANQRCHKIYHEFFGL